jgi:hypothetical protein
MIRSAIMTKSTDKVMFVSGFHRSGTTVVATAATAALRGRTLTAGDLAGHIPTLAAFLTETREAPADRGADRLPVTRDTPEEYGWLLYHASGRHALHRDDVRDGVLPNLAAGLGDGPIVLKNPWDAGHEALMLRAVPDGSILLVRRGVAAIADSSGRALLRFVGSDRYLRALMGDDRNVNTALGALAQPGWRRLILFWSRWRLRLGVLKLAARARRLPPDRVAYVSYDELSHDPAAGAAWAAHLIDPAELARAFGEHAFPDAPPDRPGGRLDRALDAYWARAWERARQRQVRTGVLAAR